MNIIYVQVKRKIHEFKNHSPQSSSDSSVPNIKRHSVENRYSKTAQNYKTKMILYGVFVCILSLVRFPSSSSSSSIFEDVSTSSPDLFDTSDGYFTSNIDLQKLLSTEEAIMFELQEYVRNEEKRLEKLKG